MEGTSKGSRFSLQSIDIKPLHKASHGSRNPRTFSLTMTCSRFVVSKAGHDAVILLWAWPPHSFWQSTTPSTSASVDSKGIFHHECFCSFSETSYILGLHNTLGKEFHQPIRCGMKQYFFLFEFAAWSFLCMCLSSSIVRTAVFIYLFCAIWDGKHFFSDVAFHHHFFSP